MRAIDDRGVLATGDGVLGPLQALEERDGPLDGLAGLGGVHVGERRDGDRGVVVGEDDVVDAAVVLLEAVEVLEPGRDGRVGVVDVRLHEHAVEDQRGDRGDVRPLLRDRPAAGLGVLLGVQVVDRFLDHLAGLAIVLLVDRLNSRGETKNCGAGREGQHGE